MSNENTQTLEELKASIDKTHNMSQKQALINKLYLEAITYREIASGVMGVDDPKGKLEG